MSYADTYFAPPRHASRARRFHPRPNALVILASCLAAGTIFYALRLTSGSGVVAVGDPAPATGAGLSSGGSAEAIAELSQEGRTAASQRMILSQQELIGGLRTRNANLHMQYQIAVGNEQAAQQELAQSQAQLQAANETVQTLVGPQLADGIYVGYLMAVGAQQSPPRLVIDRAKTVPDQGLVNDSPAWRTVPIDPTAEVVVLSLQPYHPQPISLDRLAHLFVNPAPWADPVTHAPFHITVSDGIVTSIREFRPTA